MTAPITSEDAPDAPGAPGAPAGVATVLAVLDAPAVPGAPDANATPGEGGEVVVTKSAARLFVEKACALVTQRMRENEQNQVKRRMVTTTYDTANVHLD